MAQPYRLSPEELQASMGRLGALQAQPQMGGFNPQPQKKKRNFWLDQISTAGGIAGGVLGTAVAPVFGTAAGGAIGSALGEGLENLIDPESGDWGNVAEEAALGGLFAGGPLKLGKAAFGAKTALQTGAAKGLNEALKIGGKEAASWTLRGAAGKAAAGKATGLATKQFGLTDNFLSKFAKNYGDDAGKIINKYGITNADDAAKAIASQSQVFDDLVKGAGNIRKSAIQKKLYGLSDDLVKQGPGDFKKIGQQLRGETDQLLSQYGDDIPATALNQLRQQYDSLVNYTMQQANPARYGVNKRVADGLRETIQGAAGGDLKKTGAELGKLITLSDEIAKRAPQVASRAASPLGFRNLMGGAIGAGAGGPVGAAGGMALTAMANSPTARKLYTKGALGAAEGLAASGAKKAGQSVLRDQATRFGAKAIGQNMVGGAQAQPQSLEAALASGYLGPMSNTDTTSNTMAAPMSSNTSMQSPYSEMGDMSSGANQTPWLPNGISGPLDPTTKEPVGSPYSRANLMADIQRDPQNADKYVEYYAMLDEVFNPEGEAQKPLTGPQQERADLITALDNTENVMAGGSINYGPIGSRIEGVKSFFNAADPETLTFKNTVSGLRAAITKARAGASLTEGELRMLSKYTPSETDTEQVVRSKLQSLRQLYGYQAPTGGGSTLEDMLMQQAY